MSHNGKLGFVSSLEVLAAVSRISLHDVSAIYHIAPITRTGISFVDSEAAAAAVNRPAGARLRQLQLHQIDMGSVRGNFIEKQESAKYQHD